MDVKDINEGNKLIGEFMGYDTSNHWWNHKDIKMKSLRLDLCKYHKEWGWIMYAWFFFQRKINEVSEEHGNGIYKSYLSQIQQTFCIGICEDESIETCYQALIEGIKWYN